MRKKEYLKSRSVIVQGIHSPKRFWFACGLSLGLVSLPLSTFANNWSNNKVHQFKNRFSKTESLQVVS